MEFIAKKYTILMNNEPVIVKIKNDKVLHATFMDKKVDLSGLDKEAIAQIKDNPTRVVNGNNLINNKNFTANVSKMMSQQLETAIAKNDKKHMSRFARSDLIPENMKDNFLEAINRPKGLRGLLVKAVNKSNNIFQSVVKRIDKYFDKVKDKVANQKLDKYLDKYQLKEFNKAPPIKDLDLTQSVDKKLSDLSKEFVKEHNITELTDTKTSDKLLQDEFMKKATRLGLNALEAKTALAQTVQTSQQKELFDTNVNKLSENDAKIEDMNAIIKKLESKIDMYAKKEAASNQTIEEFKTLTKDMSAVDKIDILLENKEYQQMPEANKLKLENEQLTDDVHIHEKAKEIKEISKEISETSQAVTKTVYDRTATVDFQNKTTKKEMMEKWKELQKTNKEAATPNRDFMNISAVAFGGVSTKSLEKWEQKAKKNGIDQEIVAKFKESSLRNAKELEKAGILKQSAVGEFKFVDKYAQETLYNNVDKTTDQIMTKNKGNEIEVKAIKKEELTERVKDLSSEKSFERLIGKDGKIDSEQLHKFSEHLQSLSTEVRVQEKANNVNITQEDIKLAEKSKETAKDKERERA